MTRKRWWAIGCGAVLLLVVVLAAALWLSLAPPRPVTAMAERTETLSVLPGVTVINPERDRTAGRDLLLRGDRIEVLSGGVPAGAEVLEDYRGAYVLPGLIDMHSHLPPATPLRLSEYVALLNLAHGVTTLREAGDLSGTAVQALRDGMEDGDFPGPRVFACGPFITSGEPRWLNSKVVDGREQVREAVAEVAASGHHCVKSYEEMTVEEIRVLVAEAEARGLPVISHVPYALGYEEALLPGVEHLLGVPPPESLARNHMFNRLAEWQAVDEARLDRIVEVTLAHGIANTPTLVLHHRILGLAIYPEMNDDPAVQLLPRVFRDVVWHPYEGLPIYQALPPELFEQLRASLPKKLTLVRRLWEAGAKVFVGTDCLQPFVVPGAAMFEEMRLFERAGIPPESIWAMATWRAGRELRQPALGRVEPGAPADLLVFRRDPTRDLGALDSLEAVVSKGRVFPRAHLERALADWQEHMREPQFDRLSVATARMVMDESMRRDY